MNVIDLILISGAIICFAAAFIIASRPLKQSSSQHDERKTWQTASAEKNAGIKKMGAFSELNDDNQ